MMNSASRRISVAFASMMGIGLGATLVPREIGQQDLLDHATKHMGTHSPFGHGRRSKVKKATYGRKFLRTTKAEGVYGANLRRHFDKNRLTRSQRNKFYAGKAI